MSTEPLCPWCDEPILPGEETRTITHVGDGVAVPIEWHFECSLRSVIGGINHQKQMCTCCGGKEPPDPPYMTKREAARAAVEYFNRSTPFYKTATVDPNRLALWKLHAGVKLDVKK